MADLRPQPLPYTKRGLWTGTAQLAGGITGIGQSVTKSMSGLWSSFSSGIASSILNRSLGFTDTRGGEVGEREFEKMREQRRGGRVTALGVASTMVEGVQGQEEEGDLGQSAPTLIDDEIETLYEGFQKRRKSAALIRAAAKASGMSTPSNKDSDQNSTKPTDLSSQNLDDDDLDVKADRLKHEEAKVRALNATGRIDFAIQEGVFDLSLISSLASHLGYWNDEDVVHFMISQLLARKGIRLGKNGESGGDGGRKIGADSNPTITESPPRKEPMAQIPVATAVVQGQAGWRKEGTTSGGVFGPWSGGRRGSASSQGGGGGGGGSSGVGKKL